MKIIYFTTLLPLLAFYFLYAFFRSQTDLRPTINPHKRVLQSTGDLNLPKNFVNVNNLFTIYFEFEPADYITMAIQFNIPDQYFSVGFGQTMSGSDMWIFEIINSEIIVGDYIGIGRTWPALDAAQGGTENLERLGYEITSTYSLVKIRRALNTGDPNDAVIQKSLTDIIYATGESPTMTYHGRAGRGQVTVPLIPGTESSVTDNSGAEGARIEEVHSIVSVVAWGILVDIGIIIVRFFRGVKLRIGKLVISIQLIHGILMMALIIMSATVTGLMLKINRDERGSSLSHERDKDFHFINGLVILFLVILTIILGIVNMVELKPYRKKPISLPTVKSLHRFFGVLLYLCAKANIITGVLFYNEGKWKGPVFGYLLGLLFVHIGLQVFYSYKLHTANKPPSTTYKASTSPTQIALLEAINKGTSREELIENFPRLKWVMLGNRVYDLTDWIHPGGNFIIEACLGKEVGRYFFGNYALEGTNMEPHKHSALTVSQMQKYCIGELTNVESTLVFKGTEDEATSWSSNKWKVVATAPVCSNVTEIRFQSPDFQVKNFGKSLSWLGRHYRLSQDTNSSLARLYTTAFSLSVDNFVLRQNIYRYFEDIMNDVTNPEFTYNKNYLVPHDSLPLYIKDYKAFPQSFSRLIHTTQLSDPSNQFRIEGPLGRGLEIGPDASGTHCIICAGTGVLPFVDFLNLFLWKTMYELIKQKAGVEKAEQINILGIPFDAFFNQMNIVFIGAFPGEKEVLGLDIIMKLAEVSQKYNVDNFQGMMKGYYDANITEVKESFSAEFFSKVITTEEEKFYVVGPPKLNDLVPKALQELGVPKQRIILV